MDKFLEFIVEHIGGIILLAIGGFFGWLLIQIFEQESINKANYKRIADACYSQGMVVVETDAGPRCATPQSLVKVK